MLTNDFILPQLSLSLKLWLNLLLGLNHVKEKQNETATSTWKRGHMSELTSLTIHKKGFQNCLFSKSGKVPTQKTYR